MGKIATNLEMESALLDEIESIVRAMRPGETLYAFKIRQPAKGIFLLRWLLKAVDEPAARVRTPGQTVH